MLYLTRSALLERLAVSATSCATGRGWARSVAASSIGFSLTGPAPYLMAGLTMAFKLLTMAEQRWRCLNAPHLVAQVRAGVRFRDGLRVERDTATEAVQTAA